MLNETQEREQAEEEEVAAAATAVAGVWWACGQAVSISSLLQLSFK